jgi:hypothetical protein
LNKCIQTEWRCGSLLENAMLQTNVFCDAMYFVLIIFVRSLVGECRIDDFYEDF